MQSDYFYSERTERNLKRERRFGPIKGQRLLGNPSEDTPDEVIVHLDWLRMFNDDLMMPKVYKEGADFLVEALLWGGDGTHPDRFAFPILYFYRHALELILKEIIVRGRRLGLIDAFVSDSPKRCSTCGKTMDSRKDVLEEHALMPLWNTARQVLETVSPNGPHQTLSAIEAMIQELHLVDKNGQLLRYPTDKKGTPYSHHLPDQVDLRALREGFADLWDPLSGTADSLAHWEEFRNGDVGY